MKYVLAHGYLDWNSILSKPHKIVSQGWIDCACVIHGDYYSWTYVDNLYHMLCRNLTVPVRLHVYTEQSRYVPDIYIKHALTDWGFSGPKRSWWYKLQMFNPEHHAGPLLYFDLDTVIIANIDWIWRQDLAYFWTVRDFKYLWRPNHFAINSSIMWWDTEKFANLWAELNADHLKEIARRHVGDQDYLNKALADSLVRYLDIKQIKSYRWQCKDGGFDFKRRLYKYPDTGTHLQGSESVIVFHGTPKPDQIGDSVIQTHWSAPS